MIGRTYPSKDVDFAIDSRSCMSDPCLWDVAFTFDLVVLPRLDVDTMNGVRDGFSGLDLPISVSQS
jgi:hypothetical protein